MYGKNSDWKRIEAGEVRVGNLIGGHSRNFRPIRITDVSPGAISVYLTDDEGLRSRPRKSKRLWLWIGSYTDDGEAIPSI